VEYRPSQFVCAARWWWHLILVAATTLRVAAQAPLTGLGAYDQFRTPPPPLAQNPAWTEPWFSSFRASFGVEANDNINLSQSNREADIILRPTGGAQLGYAFTEDNRLSLDLSAGYAEYLSHPSNNTFVINSEGVTGLNFNFHVSRTLVNLHDRLTLEQDPVNETEVTGNAEYRRFVNASGFSIEPESERFKITAGYDHILELYDAALANQDRSIESVSSQFGLLVGEAAVYGLVLSGAYIGSTPGANDGGFTYDVAVRASDQLSEYISYTANAGFGSAQFGGSTIPADSDRVQSFIGSLTLKHRANKWVTQSLRAGTDIVPSVLSNYRKEIYVTHLATLSFVENLAISSQLSYINSVSSALSQADRINQYLIGANVSLQLAQKLELRLNYRYTIENSSLPGAGYNQNQLLLVLTKRF